MRLQLRKLVHQLAIESAGEIRVKTLITRDEFIGKCQAGHNATLLEPEDGAEGAAEEDALNCRETQETRGEIGIL